MTQFFIILLKINLVLAIFAAAYYLVLRRLTFYGTNRIYLLFGILFSTVYPFIDLTDFFYNQQQIDQQAVAFIPAVNQKISVLAQVITEYIALINWIFFTGIFILAARLLIQFLSLYKMHRRSVPGTVDDFRVRIVHEDIGPFSFWKNIYINPSLHKEQELNTILAHENVHIKEWHTLDIILAEVSAVVYWFNPGVWLMKKAVKENLEFITDEKVLRKGVDKKAYQYSLLDVGYLAPAAAITNNFTLSDLKKRIKMMNVKRSSRLTLSRYVLLLPIVLLITLAFTVSQRNNKQEVVLQKVSTLANSAPQNTEFRNFTIEQQQEKRKRSRSAVTTAAGNVNTPAGNTRETTRLTNHTKVTGDWQSTQKIGVEGKPVITAMDLMKSNMSALGQNQQPIKVVQGFQVQGIPLKEVQVVPRKADESNTPQSTKEEVIVVGYPTRAAVPKKQ